MTYKNNHIQIKISPHIDLLLIQQGTNRISIRLGYIYRVIQKSEAREISIIRIIQLPEDF